MQVGATSDGDVPRDSTRYARNVSGHTLLVYARHAAGLTQCALAKLAGTSQPTLSAYERGAKSPTLAVAERIIEASGHHLEVMPDLEFARVPGQFGLHPFWLAKSLWRLAPERAFTQVVLPGPHLRWRAPHRLYDLADRQDRARAYELILREGGPSDLLDYVDGALLVDLWSELDLPDPIRRAWQPVIDRTVPQRRLQQEYDEEDDDPLGGLIRLRPSARAKYLQVEREEHDGAPRD